MKTIWQLTYETIPGDGEHIKEYKSFAEAKKDIREMISQICISPYTEAIRREGTYKAYRDAMADFLNNYISKKDFFSSNDAFPSTDEDDYVLETENPPDDTGEDDDERYDEDEDGDEWYDEDEDDDEDEEVDDFEIYIDKDSISFESFYEEHPTLNTNMVVMEDKTEEYMFNFSVEIAPKNRLKELQMKLIPVQYWGTSAYPILILRTLEKSQTPLDQQQIIYHISDDYDTEIERKAVGRNISLLKDLGYNIQHNGEGYFIPIPTKEPPLEQDDFKVLVESINANEKLDDARKRELIDKLFEM